MDWTLRDILFGLQNFNCKQCYLKLKLNIEGCYNTSARIELPAISAGIFDFLWLVDERPIGVQKHGLPHDPREQRFLTLIPNSQIVYSLVATVCKFRPMLNTNNVLNSTFVKRKIKKFQGIGTVVNMKHTARSYSGDSSPKCGREYGDFDASSCMTTGHFKNCSSPYFDSRFVSSWLQIIIDSAASANRSQQNEFRNKIIEHQKVNIDYVGQTIFSDENNFHFNGFFNRHNCHIWGLQNSIMFVEEKKPPKLLTVWCALWFGGIIGTFFFRNEIAYAFTVNGECFGNVVTQIFLHKLEDTVFVHLWFQWTNDGFAQVLVSSPFLFTKIRRYDFTSYHLSIFFSGVFWCVRIMLISPPLQKYFAIEIESAFNACYTKVVMVIHWLFCSICSARINA